MRYFALLASLYIVLAVVFVVFIHFHPLLYYWYISSVGAPARGVFAVAFLIAVFTVIMSLED